MYPTAAFFVLLGNLAAVTWGRNELNSHHRSAEEVVDATSFSVVYFYPLVQYVTTFGPTLRQLAANIFEKQVKIASIDQQVVAISNVDTVYARAVVDLSEHDVVLTIPEIDAERAHIFPFHDLYGNNFVNLGSFSNASAGRYLLSHAQPGSPGIQLLDDDATYTGIINFPTVYGAIFARILVFDPAGNTEEIAQLEDIEANIIMEPVPKSEPCTRYPPLTTELLQNLSLAEAKALGAQQLDEGNMTLLLELAAKVASYNLPIDNPDNAEVLKNLSIAGARHGVYRKPPSLNISAVNAESNATLRAAAADPTNFSPSPPWTGFARSALGNFHRLYALRAFVSGNLGYLAITTDQNFPRNPIGNPLSLGPDECFIFTFPRRPPLEPAGFWSLTAYGSDRFFVPNDLDRYSLGDRSAITFADGTPVYGSEAEDGLFQLLVQPANIAPPANWTSNWLPAPAGGGPVYLFLRFYGPTADIVNGTNVFPQDATAHPAIRQ